MNKYYLATLVFLGTLFGSVNAEDKVTVDKVIYKWSSDGETRYGHIKPIDVKDFVKLDSEGLIIEDYSKDFDEIIQVSVRPDIKKDGDTSAADGKKQNSKKTAENGKDKDQIQADKNKANCDIAQKNMATLTGGEVYEKDEKGNMIRLKKDDVEMKRKNVEKDVAYFCNTAEVSQ